MNMQTHHSGQFLGQVLNQGGTMLPGSSQQNGNPVSSQMQNHGIPRTAPPPVMMDPEIGRMRKRMQEKIYEFLMARRQQSNDVGNKKLMDLVKRIEHSLFKTSTSKEEYLNLETLERRLHMLVKRPPLTNHNQQLAHANSSVGTMIPTPGFQQTGNSSLIGTSSMDSSLVAINSSNTIASSTVNSGSFFPTRNGSSGSAHGGYFSSSDGALAGGYQQPSNSFMVNTGGMNMGTSMGAQRMTSQNIPTPGISNSNNDINNANNNNLMNVELSNGVGACPDLSILTIITNDQ